MGEGKRGRGRPRKEEYEKKNERVFFRTTKLYKTKLEYLSSLNNVSMAQMIERMIDNTLETEQKTNL